MKRMIPGEKKYFQDSKRDANDTCTPCKLIVSMLHTAVRSGNDDAKGLEKIVWDVCKIIEEQETLQECQVLVNFMDRVRNWLMNDQEDATEICKNLELCTEYNLKHPDYKRVLLLQGRVMTSLRFSDLMKVNLKKHHGFVTPHGH